jgi:hypothetical protein
MAIELRQLQASAYAVIAACHRHHRLDVPHTLWYFSSNFMCQPAPQATEQRDREAVMAISPYHSRGHSHMDAPTPPHILAAFAADLAIPFATSCRDLAVFATHNPKRQVAASRESA